MVLFAPRTEGNGGGDTFVPTGGTVTVTQMGTTTGTHLKATYTDFHVRAVGGVARQT